MRIAIVTQNDPFFLGRSLDYLLNGMSGRHEIVCCVLLGASPFGKKESLTDKIVKTIKIFGIPFLLGYGVYFIKGFIKGFPSVGQVLKKNNIPPINLTKGINHEESLAIIKSFEPDLLISIAGNQ